MANQGYHQNYRQGPPSQQQQYYNDYHEQRGYDNGRQNRDYGQRSQGYNRFQDQDQDQNYGAQHYQSYDQQYDQYEGWDNRQYNEPYYEDHVNQRDQQDQQYDHGPRQDRSYQYDDRYRMNGPGRPPVQNAQGRTMPHSTGNRPPPRSGPGGPNGQRGNIPPGNGSYGYGENNFKPPRVRERILNQEPESPKTSSWDNPFPTFPSKKKQAETRKVDTDDQKGIQPTAPALSQDGPRPSTSHGNRQHGQPSDSELPRPHTSHSHRGVEPFKSPVDAPPMPFRNEITHSQPQSNFREAPLNNADQARPAPRRAMTGPVPKQALHGYNQAESDLPRNGGYGGLAYNDYPPQRHSEEQEYQNRLPQDRAADQYEYGAFRPLDHRDESGPRSAPSSQEHFSSKAPYDNDNYAPQTSNYRNPQSPRSPPLQQRKFSGQAPRDRISNGHRRQSSDQARLRNPLDDDRNYAPETYRGAPLTKKSSPDMPNFDNIPDAMTDKAEDHLGLSKPPMSLAYRKPTYQNPVDSSSMHEQHQSINDDSGLASPLAQFSFGLDDKTRVPIQNGPQAPANSEPQYAADEYRNNSRRPPPGQDRQMRYPERSASQPQDGPPNSPRGFPGSKPPPFRPGLAQPPPRGQYQGNDYQDNEYNHQDYNSTNYDARYSQDEDYNRSNMPPQQQLSQGEFPRQEYDQRIQPRTGFVQHQVPPRPATAGPSRPNQMPNYGSRNSSESYKLNGMQNPDSLPAHPAPFRPGLMQPTPPAPRPTPPPQQQPPRPQPQMHQRDPSIPQASAASEPPVTIQELNALREEYKNRPNDQKLGLRFAKRLVEAAKVLASENGRADPKQTAKNRERYILDAHKIVKKLCSSGYPDAMFYLADCYGQGMLGLEADPKEAFSLYQSAAKLGHPQAAYRVAVCCELGAEEGGGTRRDPLKAVQWYKRAATLGDTPAMYKMGMIQLKGLLGQQKSPREAISWLKRASERADAENPHALHELGLLYENAQSTDIILKDEKYALQLFQQAAELGYKYSQFRLGSAYEYGLLGLPRDPRMSIAWYTRAAKQGEHQSEFALSGWYLTGSGQPGPGEQTLLQQNDTEAYLWARKAASSGLAKAEYAMGYYTEVGIGTTANIEEAKRWYYRAAAQHHPKARERLEDLKRGGQRMQKTRVSRSNVGKHNEGECTVM